MCFFNFGALRLKRGSSTGIAVRCGAYELLGDKSLQEELDFSAYAVVVESELQDCWTMRNQGAYQP